MTLLKSLAPTARRFAVTTIGAVSLAVIGLMTTIGSSPAQSPSCATHVDVVTKLKDGYSEQPIAIGLATNGNLIEVFSTKEGDTWTLIVTRPDGLSCILATGEAWETVAKFTKGESTS